MIFVKDLKYHSLTFQEQIILEGFSEFDVMVLLRVESQHKVYFPDSISKVHSLMLWSEERRLLGHCFDLRTQRINILISTIAEPATVQT